MTPTESIDEPRRRFRRPLVAASGATLLVAAGGLAWVQSGAGADPVSTDVAATCAIAGGNSDVTVPMTVDDKVDPIAPGGAETLSIAQGLGQLPVEVTIDKVVVTTPIPAQIASTDSVTFEGGNMTGSSAVDGQNLVVTFTGPQSSSQAQFPTVIVNQTVSDSPGAGPIEWKVWSQMVVDTNYGQASCTPKDPATVLNTTAISGAGTTTTTAPGTDGSTTPTLPGDPTSTTTTPPVTTPPTTTPPTTTPPAAPGATVCVKVDSSLPVPTGAIPCPIAIPPSGGGGDLPVPVPGAGGLPVPLPAPGAGGLPVPLPVPLPAPGDGGGLPVPLPAPGGGTGGVTLDLGLQVGVSL